jgi:hypothetical protein
VAGNRYFHVELVSFGLILLSVPSFDDLLSSLGHFVDGTIKIEMCSQITSIEFGGILRAGWGKPAESMII